MLLDSLPASGRLANRTRGSVTTNTAFASSSTDRSTSLLIMSIVGGAIFGAVLTASGNFNLANGEDFAISSEALRDWGIDVAAIVVASLAAWRLSAGAVMARIAKPMAIRALIFGALALFSLPAFWLGIYAVFAGAAFALGAFAWNGATAHGTKVIAAIGMVLAALGTVACAGANLFG